MNKKLRGDISLEDILSMYRKEKDGRVKERLLTVKLAYEGKKVSEISTELGVCKKTIYNWLDLWNRDGFDGLQPKHAQSGRERYLPPHEWERIFAEVRDKEYSLQEIREYIKRTRGTDYSYQAVWKIFNQRFDN